MSSIGRCAKKLSARLIWALPSVFSLQRLLGTRSGFRCLVFHDISDHPSPFTEGLGVSMTTAEFRSCIDYLVKHYYIATLNEILTSDEVDTDGKPALLITFDDAYRSVYTNALPMLREEGIPAVFFVNAALIGNRTLSTDNLVTYIANTFGLSTLVGFLRERAYPVQDSVKSIGEFLQSAVAPLGYQQVADFQATLASHFGVKPNELANEADLYLHVEDLKAISDSCVEIGNHTLSHSFCRGLTTSELEIEVGTNKLMLEDWVNCPVRAFSVPYGAQADLTESLLEILSRNDTEYIFLVEGLINRHPPDLLKLVRISPRRFEHESELFVDLEIMPLLREVRNRVSVYTKAR